MGPGLEGWIFNIPGQSRLVGRGGNPQQVGHAKQVCFKKRSKEIIMYWLYEVMLTMNSKV